MSKYYRIVLEEYDIKPSGEMQENIILEGEVSAPSSCLDFGIRHEEQMELISKAQDKILQLQASQLAFTDGSCPKGLLKNMVLTRRGFMMFLAIIGLPCPADDVIHAAMLLLTPCRVCWGNLYLVS